MPFTMNSDNATSVYQPEPCGLYDYVIKKVPELRATAKGFRVVRVEVVIGERNGKDIFARDDIFVTEDSSWRVERFLRSCKGSIQMDDEKFCSEEFRRSLVGCKGKADIGILLYGKNGQMRKVNEVANWVSDKNPSLELDPKTPFTTNNFNTPANPVGAAGAVAAPRSATTGEELPTNIGETEVPADDGDVPF